VQEFSEKSSRLELPEAVWHLVGHLQSNKARRAAELFHRIDSLDNPRLGRKLSEAVAALEGIAVRGLMTIPPFLEPPERVRPFFRGLRELAEEVDHREFPGVAMKELSMGMSHDFEVAIEEGATQVRVGTAIFGERPAE
jgi:uncharacterized pyridoxal phosphate-containing UPF0001 family protein